MSDPLEQSREIITQSIALCNPYAIVLAMSGGDDSLTAYEQSGL